MAMAAVGFSVGLAEAVFGYEESVRRTLEISLLDRQRVLETQCLQLAHVDAEKRDTLQDLQDRNCELQALIESSCREKKSAETHVSSLRKELEDLRKVADGADALVAEKLSLRRQVATLETQLRAYQKDGEQYQQLYAEKLGLDRQVQELQLQIQSWEKSRSTVSAKERDLQAALEDTRQANATLNLQCDKTKAELAHAQTQKSKTDSTRTRLEELEKLKASLALQTSQYEKSQAELAKARALFSRKEEQLVQKCNKLESKLELAKEKEHTFKPKEKAATGTVGQKRKLQAMDATPNADKGKKVPTQSTFSTTPFFVRQSSVMPPSPKPGSLSALQLHPAEAQPASRGAKLTDVDQLDEPEPDMEPAAIDATSNVSAAPANMPPPKKRKQKIGGGARTLFDEDAPLVRPAAVRTPKFGLFVSPPKKRSTGLDSIKSAFTFKKVNIV